MHKSAAGVLFVGPTTGSILMVKPHYRQHWDIPGGMVEDGELPREAAKREVMEELGVDVEVGRLLVVDTLLMADGDLLTAYIYEGTLREGVRFVLDHEELEDWGWTSYEMAIARTRTAPLFFERLLMAHQAYVEKSQGFLERRA